MNWLLIGTLLGSIVTSGHESREACEGRAVLLREKGATAQCVQSSSHGITFNGGGCINCIVPLGQGR